VVGVGGGGGGGGVGVKKTCSQSSGKYNLSSPLIYLWLGLCAP